MADNVTVENGSTLSDYTVATDDDGAAQHQYVKLEWGGDGTFTKVAAGASAVPIQDGGNTISIDDGAGSITVDGTVTNTPSGDHTVVGKAADGAAVSGNPVRIAGKNGGNTQDILTNASGNLEVVGTGTAGEVSIDLESQFAEDIAHISGDSGIAILGVRQDADTSPVSATGDYHNLIFDNAGNLKVNVKTGSAGGTQYTEADVDASITGTAILWEDAADTLRAVSAAKPLPVSDAGGSLTVDGTVAVSGSVDTELPTAIAPGDTDANPTAPEVVARTSSWNGTQWVRNRTLLGDGVAAGGSPNFSPMVYNGANYDRMRGTAADGLLVNLGTNNDVTVTGTATVTQGAAGTAWEVIGDVAHDAAAPANPVVTGGQMETQADSAPGTRAGTDGDAVKLAVTDGAQFVINGTPQQWSYHFNGSTAQTDTTVHAAPGAGLSLYVTTIVFSSGAATAINAFFEEGASTVLGPYYLEAVAGRGTCINFAVPKKITANTALTWTSSAAIAHSLDVTGFVAPG